MSAHLVQQNFYCIHKFTMQFFLTLSGNTCSLLAQRSKHCHGGHSICVHFVKVKIYVTFLMCLAKVNCLEFVEVWWKKFQGESLYFLVNTSFSFSLFFSSVFFQSILFVCFIFINYCRLVSTQMQLTNISISVKRWRTLKSHPTSHGKCTFSLDPDSSFIKLVLDKYRLSRTEHYDVQKTDVTLQHPSTILRIFK